MFVFVLSVSVFAQNLQLKKGIRTPKQFTEQKIAIEPEKATGVSIVTPTPSKTKTSGIVNVITLGTSANAYGYGYWGGQKTMVWADDTLGIITNLHRMGPGTSPPNLSGYLAVDKATNQGQDVSDWTLNYQVSAANESGTDVSRYPQAVIYNPGGNTDLSKVYVAYFCPNLSNAGTWGGYNYGVCNWTDQTDSTKHMQWYNPPPYTYIADGMTMTHKGISILCDLDRDFTNPSAGVYMGDIIMNRGVWNDVAKDFEYTQFLIPLPTLDNMFPIDNRIAASPDGNTIWMVTLANNDGASQTGAFKNFYPIMQSSNDGGVTWNDPIAVQLDGPDGIDGIKNALSDNILTFIFGGTPPPRDQIGYTTTVDCDLVVDKWGNPHIGVAVGVTTLDQDYNFYINDSCLTVFDIYSQDDGITWQAQKMGSLKTFDGTFGTIAEYNRVQIAINEQGDHVFLTWLDTHVDGVTTNTEPDVFARGFNLLENKITSNAGADNSNNVTYLSEVFQMATFQCTSHYVFSKAGGGHIIPIVTELLTNNDDVLPVTFKYISDFSYMPSDYTIESTNPPFPVGINDNKKEMTLNAQIFPNPLNGIGSLTVNLKQSGNLSIDITNLVGQKVISFDKGFVDAGSLQFTIDASRLQAGVYFYTIKLNDQKYTNKMVVE